MNKKEGIFRSAVLLLLFVFTVPINAEGEEKFDFIIYGAGIGGSVLARRLSDNPKWTVLLLEHGSADAAVSAIPLNVDRLPHDCSNSFGYMYEPSDNYCLAMTNTQCNLQQGKGFGGQSLIGDMIYSRGNRKDYDSWCKQSKGWCFKDVLPFFKKLENNQIPGEKIEFCGVDGPITISYANYRTGVFAAFLLAGTELGSPWVNYNGKHQTGFSMAQTTTKDGRRQNAFNEYVKPVEERENLIIRDAVEFVKLTFSDDYVGEDKTRLRVIGMEYKQRGFANTVLANREVILANSAVDNAMQLMLSGVGPQDHLESVGITTVKDLRVGYNFHEVIGVGGLTFFSDVKTLDLEDAFTPNNVLEFLTNGTGQASSTVIEALAFLETSPKLKDYPNFELVLRGASLLTTPISRASHLNINENIFNEHFSEVMDQKANSFTIEAAVLRPRSRGRVMLRSADPTDLPIVQGNFYSNPYDMKTALKAIKATLKLMETDAFKTINARFHDKVFTPCADKGYVKDAENSDYWKCYARYWSMPLERWAGTTKMGRNSDAVVDAKLRVHGIKNLRVLGTSIAPQQITGHTDGVEYMLGEKLADIMCRYHNFLDETVLSSHEESDESEEYLIRQKANGKGVTEDNFVDNEERKLN